MDDFVKIVDKILSILPKLKTPLQLTGLLVTIIAALIVKIISPDNVAAMMSAGMIGVGLIIFATMFMVLPLILETQRAIFFVAMFLIYAVVTGYLVNLTYLYVRNAQLSLSDQGVATIAVNLQKRHDVLVARIRENNSRLMELQRRRDSSQSRQETEDILRTIEQPQQQLKDDGLSLAALERRQGDLRGTRDLAQELTVELQRLADEGQGTDRQANSELERARVGAANGEYATAEQFLQERLKEQQKERANTLLLLGQIKELRGDIGAAETCYAEAATLSPENPVVLEYDARSNACSASFRRQDRRSTRSSLRIPARPIPLEYGCLPTLRSPTGKMEILRRQGKPLRKHTRISSSESRSCIGRAKLGILLLG